MLAKGMGIYCSFCSSQDYSLTLVSSFSSFILPLISGSRDQLQQVAPPICHSPSFSDSMIGQATSLNRVRTELNSDGDLDTSIGQMYACVEGWCPEEIILSERLSEKDGQLLDGGSCNSFLFLISAYSRTVPNLPPPNVHPGIGIILPQSLSTLIDVPLHKKLITHPDSTSTQPRFLRKVKGIHSLAMALSWM